VKVPERLIIIGAATPTIIRVIDDLNQRQERNIEIVGFLDNAHATLGSSVFGQKVLGGFDAVKKFERGAVALINTIAGSIITRVDTTRFFLELGYQFTNIVHPGVNLTYVKMGVGNLIYENALIQPFVEIGNHCVISSNSGVAHETTIRDYCFIGPASYICGKVEIGERVFVGTGARILPRLRIGSGAEIGAGALIHKPVRDGQVAIGAPGRLR
jgi:sugar O-acyltransferase (sialic acid O-acetyltransferase NeuD family)